ncbi:MAG: family transporter [Rhodospirillales bacterium]|nr:family transporter [Rhodospirillales bacterium]
MAPKIVLGLLLGIGSSVIWGGHAVVARAALAGQGLVPLDLAAFRYSIAALVLLPLLWRGRAALAQVGVVRLLALTALGGAPNLLMFVGGLVYAPATHGGTISPMTVPVVGALLAIPLLREVPTPGRWAALAAMAAGVLLIGWDGIAGVAAGAWRGDLMLLGAGASWGAFTVLLRRWQVPAMASTAAVTAISALLVLPFWLPWRSAEVMAMPAGVVIPHLIAQGLFLGAVAMFLYARAVELLGATRASTLSVIVPVVALVLAAFVLAEPIGVLQLLGAALAVGGMGAAVLFTGRKQG